MSENSQAVKNKIYDFILRYKQERDGNAPTIREIQEGCHISTTSYVKYQLLRLQADGKIVAGGDAGARRLIEVVGGQWIPPQPPIAGD